MDIKEITERLADIRAYDEAYYHRGERLISDAEYDSLRKAVTAAAVNHPEIKQELDKVGFAPANRGTLLPVPMLSLDATFTKAEARKKLAGILKALGKKEGDVTFILQPKYDGVASSFSYNGDVVSGYTRGDGTTGEPIVKIADKIDFSLVSNVAKKSKLLQGELVVTESTYAKLLAAGHRYVNELTATVGIVNSDTTKPGHEQALLFIPYGAVPSEHYKTYGELLDSLFTDSVAPWSAAADISLDAADLDTVTQVAEQMALTEVHHRRYHIFRTMEQLENLLDWYSEKRRKFKVGMDGVVIRVNDLALAATLPPTRRHPTDAFSFKFSAESEITLADTVSYTVVASGRVTPVLSISPVWLKGKEVKNLSLFGLGAFAELGLSKGDLIEVELVGGSAPAFKRIAVKSSGPTWPAITDCPICDAELKLEGRHGYCVNESCTGRNADRIRKFLKSLKISRSQMDMCTIEKLCEAGVLEQLVDFWTVTRKDIEWVYDDHPGQVDSALRTLERVKQAYDKTDDLTILKIYQLLGVTPSLADELKKLCGTERFVPLRQAIKETTQVSEVVAGAMAIK